MSVVNALAAMIAVSKGSPNLAAPCCDRTVSLESKSVTSCLWPLMTITLDVCIDEGKEAVSPKAQ